MISAPSTARSAGSSASTVRATPTRWRRPGATSSSPTWPTCCGKAR